MPGNSQRKGAVRNTEAKKPRGVGSGGNRRQGLEGKGPTPKAVDSLMRLDLPADVNIEIKL